MAKVKLTPGRIREFITEKGQAFLWDSATPGLAVRATAGGRQAFIFQSKLNGQDLRITIGDVRAWTLEDARSEARRLATRIDQGIDPRLEKKELIAATVEKQREIHRLEATVAEVWAQYLEARRGRWSERTWIDHAKVAHPGGEPYKRGHGITEPGPLANLMPLKLSELTAERVAAWLEEENSRRPTRAALAYRLLRAFLRWAADKPDYQGIANRDAVSTRVSRDHVARVRAKEGDVLQREQLPLWFEAVCKLRNPVQAAYLQALLLTGARREELAGLRWEDVDFQWRSLTIRDKVEGERTIPLTPYVTLLLSNLPRRNDWVFSSPTAASGRIQEPRIAHDKALISAGLPHVSLHGLRRSFGTLAEWTETPVGIVAQIQGHKPSAVAEKHYRRRPLDLLRMWHTKIEAWVLEQAGIKLPGEDAATHP